MRRALKSRFGMDIERDGVTASGSAPCSFERVSLEEQQAQVRGAPAVADVAHAA